MKIIRKMQHTINDIRCGEVFEFRGDLYIKTDNYIDEEIVAVELSKGLSETFGIDTPVSAINGSFVIDEEEEK